MGVAEMYPGFVRPGRAGALQQHAGNDLETVGDAMLQLLQQNGLLAYQVVLLPITETPLSHVRDRQYNAHVLGIGIAQLVGAQHELAGLEAGPLEVHFVARNLGRPRGGGLQQGRELRHIPLAGAH
jgi:hypothetical protein